MLAGERAGGELRAPRAAMHLRDNGGSKSIHGSDAHIGQSRDLLERPRAWEENSPVERP